MLEGGVVLCSGGVLCLFCCGVLWCFCDVVVVLKIFFRSFSVVVLHPIMMASWPQLAVVLLFGVVVKHPLSMAQLDHLAG